MNDWETFIWNNSEPKLVQFFQVNPVVIHSPDSFGEYVLERAAFFLKYELVAVLLQLGANPNQVDELGQLPLHSAISSCKEDPDRALDIIRLLLSNGANLERRGYRDYTALHCACLAGSLNIVSLLSSYGADINAKSEEWMNGGRTPLDLAEMQKHTEIVDYLRVRGGRNA